MDRHFRDEQNHKTKELIALFGVQHLLYDWMEEESVQGHMDTCTEQAQQHLNE